MDTILERKVDVEGEIFPLEFILKQLKIGTDTQFITDFNHSLKINTSNSNRAIWNLICSKRDVKLWQIGMKPNIHWKITDVKKYFGIKGNKDTIVDKIELLCELFIPQKDEV
tara:strand:- start:162 stop:497 length:336 start_codon:yes stop_codon:yes gene_type:complete